jgi:hypothetical protein
MNEQQKDFLSQMNGFWGKLPARKTKLLIGKPLRLLSCPAGKQLMGRQSNTATNP